MNWNDENGDGGAFGQAFQRQFKRSIGVPGEPSTQAAASADAAPLGVNPLRGPRGGYQPPTPQAFQAGPGSPMIPGKRTDLHRPPPPQAFQAVPGNTGIVPPWMRQNGPGGGGWNNAPQGGGWQNDKEYLSSLRSPSSLGVGYDPSKDITRQGSDEDYARWKSAREFHPLDTFMDPWQRVPPNNPKWAYFDGPNGPDGRPMDTVPTENPIGLGYAPDAQNDMAGLALRGYYRDENNNWQMRPNPNRAPAPGRSNGRPMGAPPAPPPIPPGTGGLDPVGPGGGLGGPQGRDRMPGNFAAAPPQIKTPDNGWQWGDLNNLTNRWKG